MSAGRTILFEETRELEGTKTDGALETALVEVTLYKWSDGSRDDATEFILRTKTRGWGYPRPEENKEILSREGGMNEEANLIRKAIKCFEFEIERVRLVGKYELKLENLRRI